MKYVFLLCVLFSLPLKAQIGKAEKVADTKVIGIADKGVGLPKLEVEDNLYYLSFYNLEYPNLREIEVLSFYGTPEDLDYLFNFLKGQFGTKEAKTISIGEKQILVKKSMGSIRVSILNENSWFYLSKKQTDRLFGKS